MKNILLVEDDRDQAERLQNLICSSIPGCSITICGTEADAREKAEKADYNLMILDLILESGSGLGFAKWVRTIPRYQMVWILIVTGYNQYAMDAISATHCFDYILKPYKDSELLATVDRLLRMKISRDTSASYLTVLSKGVSIKVRLSDILFFEINNKNLDIHTTNKVFSIKRYTLSKIKNQLPKNMFLQCHRSYIINSEKISAIESRGRETYLMINGNEKPIPVGIRYKATLGLDGA